MANKIIVTACAAVVGLALRKTTLDSLHPNSRDDEADEMIEEANVVEICIRVGNRGCYEIREHQDRVNNNRKHYLKIPPNASS